MNVRSFSDTPMQFNALVLTSGVTGDKQIAATRSSSRVIYIIVLRRSKSSPEAQHNGYIPSDDSEHSNLVCPLPSSMVQLQQNNDFLRAALTSLLLLHLGAGHSGILV